MISILSSPLALIRIFAYLVLLVFHVALFAFAGSWYAAVNRFSFLSPFWGNLIFLCADQLLYISTPLLYRLVVSPIHRSVARRRLMSMLDASDHSLNRSSPPQSEETVSGPPPSFSCASSVPYPSSSSPSSCESAFLPSQLKRTKLTRQGLVSDLPFSSRSSSSGSSLIAATL